MVTKSKTAAAASASAKPRPAVKRPVKTAPLKPAAGKRVEPVAAKARVEAPKKREKLIRDGFTIPKGEYAALADLKQRAAKLGHTAKKSELLRAGIKLLAGLADARFVAALAAVPTIKTGRPRASEPAATPSAAEPKAMAKKPAAKKAVAKKA
ncbi:hypothetical protein [Methylibium sp.]|uniref:hypothetical protein n=1 Tax=Methylibium sp. TaxID=2067992 RepID=UPI003D111102